MPLKYFWTNSTYLKISKSAHISTDQFLISFTFSKVSGRSFGGWRRGFAKAQSISWLPQAMAANLGSQ
jgi:hypothetical protein